MTEPCKKISLPYLFKKVAEGKPIIWLTCANVFPWMKMWD